MWSEPGVFPPARAAAARTTLLLVDDTRTNLVLLESALEQDYRLLMAGSGEQALQIASAQAPDLVLLDVMMPGMDGFETARALRGLPGLHELPIIFVTAHSDDAIQVHGLEQGAVDFLTKPFSLAVLRRRVANVIERQRLRCEAVQHQRELTALLESQTQARSLFESVFNASIDALLVTDARFQLLQANERMRPLFGIDADTPIEGLDLLGALRQLADGSRLAPEQLLHSAAPIECLLQTAAGRQVPVAITCRSFLHRVGALGHLVSVRDISARLLLEAEKRSASERLGEAQLALEAARRRELETGAAIQQRLLFGHPPPGQKSFAFAYYNQASQGVAGDFYTFTRFSEDCFEILTGDVMGKGVAAALIAASILSAYRKCLSELIAQRGGVAPSPAELVNAMHAVATPELARLESFATLCLLRLDRSRATACWVNAGHTPSLLARARRSEVLALEGDNLPLGVLEHEVYTERQIQLECGDMLLLYSDGLSESLDDAGVEYGTRRIAHILGQGVEAALPPSAVLNSLRLDLLAHSGQTGGHDDCTAIVVQAQQDICECGDSDRHGRLLRQLDLPRCAEQLHLLRQAIAEFAADQTEDFVQALTSAASAVAAHVLRRDRVRLPDAPLTVLLEHRRQEISVTLIHEGDPGAPGDGPDPDLSGGAVDGWGPCSMSHCVDRIERGRPMPGLSSIVLCKRLPQSPG